jgi:hypothetical protein
MAEIITFNIFSATTGAPLPGVNATWNYFQRRNKDGSYTDLAPGPTLAAAPSGGGAYEGSLDSSLLTPGSIIKGIIDCTAAAAARYLEYEVRASDIGGFGGTLQVSDGEEIVLDVTDQAPPFTFVLRDQNGRPVNLSAGSPSVTFSMWPAAGGDPVADDVDCTIVNAANGIVRLDWPSDATTSPGSFLARFALTQNAVLSHFPVSRTLVVRVQSVSP